MTWSLGQVESWYTSWKIQEKIDGKPFVVQESKDRFLIFEDISGKRTVHEHVIKYDRLPADKMVFLDEILSIGGELYIPKTDWRYADLCLV